MNLGETATLLGLCAAYDNRTVDPVAVEAWHAQLERYPFEDCRRAVLDHYGQSTERVMPAHVRALVRKVREARIDSTPTEQPPPDLTVREYQEWLRDQRRRIADGWEPRELSGRPIDLPELLPSPE